MKTSTLLCAMVLILGASALSTFAQKLDVFADQMFRPALDEIAPLFSEQTGFEMEISLGRSTILAERIRNGTQADLFFPASEEVMRQMQEKGLVDVALKRHILDLPSTEPVVDGVVPPPQQISAAVMVSATNRLQAMAFLEFLTSETARGAFTRQGFALP